MELTNGHVRAAAGLGLGLRAGRQELAIAGEEAGSNCAIGPPGRCDRLQGP